MNKLVFLYKKYYDRIGTATLTLALTPTAACPNLNKAEGMLGLDVSDGKFNCYLMSFIDKLMPVVYILAVLMVIVSGVQYMLAGESADNAKKAKTRIGGIVTGIIFYALMRAVLNFIGGSSLKLN